jgi:hypothetical protein
VRRDGLNNTQMLWHVTEPWRLETDKAKGHMSLAEEWEEYGGLWRTALEPQLRGKHEAQALATLGLSPVATAAPHVPTFPTTPIHEFLHRIQAALDKFKARLSVISSTRQSHTFLHSIGSACSTVR